MRFTKKYKHDQGERIICPSKEKKRAYVVGKYIVNVYREFKMFDHHFIVNKNRVGYTVTELSTGLRIIPSYKTIDEAIMRAKKKLRNVGRDKLEKYINRAHKFFGYLNEDYLVKK